MFTNKSYVQFRIRNYVIEQLINLPNNYLAFLPLTFINTQFGIRNILSKKFEILSNAIKLISDTINTTHLVISEDRKLLHTFKSNV